MQYAFPGAQTEWSDILQLLKTDDEMLNYQGVFNLRDSLSYAQENQMHGFNCDQFLEVLVKIIKREPISDLSNEVKLFAIQSLVSLMDIFPSLVNSLVNAGLVKSMTQVLQNSLGFIDLTEACIKAFEKIVVENPPAVLRSGSVSCLLEQMDFLEVSTQQKIFRIILKIARHSSTEADFDTYLLPILPFICMNMNSDPMRVEEISKILNEIQESFLIFLSHLTDCDRLGPQFDKLMDSGVFDLILDQLSQYAETNTKLMVSYSYYVSQTLKHHHVIKNEIHDQINSKQSKQHLLTNQTILNYFKILNNASVFSERVSNKLFSFPSISNDLAAFLPDSQLHKGSHYDPSEYPMIFEVVSLLNSLLAIQSDEVVSRLPQEAQSAFEKRVVVRSQLEQRKFAFQSSAEMEDKIRQMALELLPRIFLVFESTINSEYKMRILEVINKIVGLMTDSLLRSSICPIQFATFVSQILSQKSISSIQPALGIIQKVLNGSPLTFSIPLMREGVVEFIRQLADEEGFKKLMGIKQSIDIKEPQFNFEIYQLKDTISDLKQNNPDDFHTRDIYERRLLDIVERQKVLESQQKAQQQVPQQNKSVKVIQLASLLLKDFFDNEEFQQKLWEFSDQNKHLIKLREQLSAVASEIKSRAAEVQRSREDFSQLKETLLKCREILSTKDSITTYELKESKFIAALECLLTKTPSQVQKIIILERTQSSLVDEQILEDSGDDGLMRDEGRCMIQRIKLFAQVMLSTKNDKESLPMRTLLEGCARSISENDQFLVSQNVGKEGNKLMSPFYQIGRGGERNINDIDNCINALKQFQRRVDINLVYDPLKKEVSSAKKQPQPQAIVENVTQFDKNLMEKNEQNEIEEFGEEDDFDAEKMLNKIEERLNQNSLEMIPSILRKFQSTKAPIMNLAASPDKDLLIKNEIDKRVLEKSKVYLKRHMLYSELKTIDVTVEQSSCLQILEDFLRNRIKNIQDVKRLKLDFGRLGPFGDMGSKSGGKEGLFGGGYFQSISQKILKKNLGNGARKLLDKINERLTALLNQSAKAIKIKVGGKSAKKEEGEQMEEVEEGANQEEQDYEDMDDQEDEEDIQNEILRQKQLDDFVETVAKEMVDANIPEDQKQILAKILTRQQIYLMDQFRMNIEENARQEEGLGENNNDVVDFQIFRAEEWIEEFQFVMERLQGRYFEKKAETRDQKEVGKQEEEKKETKVEEKEVREGDVEMADLSEEPSQRVETGQKEGEDGKMEKELEEQERSIKQAIQQQKELRSKLAGRHLVQQNSAEEIGFSEQTKDVMHQDLEDLIRQNGEDIEFEFFFEGKQVFPNQCIFEVIRAGDPKQRQADMIVEQSEQMRILQRREEELRTQASELNRKVGEFENMDEGELKRRSESLKKMFVEIQQQIRGTLTGFKNISLLTHPLHKVTFNIKDKRNEVKDLRRQRLDSLLEITQQTLRRSRTKSEAVKDISSQSVDEFVVNLLQQEFRVFSTDQSTDSQRQQVESCLKIMKVVNFIVCNSDLLSDQGVKLITKDQLASESQEDLQNQILFGQKVKSLIQSGFVHHKLDSYLQRSIKDPFSLFKGGVSGDLKQIYSSCPFLFPFTTKELYFKIVSFVSAIDIHRSIYFLKQYLKLNSAHKASVIEKDNLKKLAKQKVVVQRDKLIESAFQLITKIDKRSFLEFEFMGEEGTGLGPTLEFYDDIAEKIKEWGCQINENVQYRMWKNTKDNYLFPSPVCLISFTQEKIQQIYEMFRLCGTIIAKAIVDDRQIDLPISPLFWRLCLGEKLTIFDLRSIDEAVYGTIAEFQSVCNRLNEVEEKFQGKEDSELKRRELQSLTLKNGSKVEDFCLDFTLPCYDYIELIPKGKQQEVTLFNAQDYVDLVLHYTFHETLKLQVQGFKKGFNSIFPISSLSSFLHSSSSEEEIEKIVCGMRCQGWDDMETLKKYIIPDHGYNRNSAQYLYFLRYMSELDDFHRKQLLKFLIGSKRLPLGGFKSLQPNLTIVLKKANPGQESDQSLPSVMACHNYVKCPMYSSYEVFKSKFDFAVREGQQNFTLS